jgi:hypothetical protein
MKQTLKYVAGIYGLAILLFLLDAIGWVRLHENLHRVFMDVGIALLAVGAIHLLDHYSLIREVSAQIVERARGLFELKVTEATGEMTKEVSGAVNNAADGIVVDVSEKVKEAFAEASEVLRRQVKSIESMEKCNLHAIYPSRGAAAEAISESIARSTEVRLMGISLNEFGRDDREEKSPLIKAWKQLVQDISDGKKRARLLLIDPSCHGAVLRSYSETAATRGVVQDRLDDDVVAVARLLRSVRLTLKDRSSLQVRLYRATPTMFICGLDSGTFVQSYYYWNPRLEGSPIPVMHYLNRDRQGDKVNLHLEMEKHFNFIWEHASIRLDSLEEEAGPKSKVDDVVPHRPHFLPDLGKTGVETRGVEWGVHASAMENVYTDRFRAALRMQEEIETSKRIWIQGITLKAFFDPSSRLAVSLAKRIKNQKDGDDIQILLLDPDCDQAKVRAYREYLLNHPAIPFDDFTQHHYVNNSLLWRHLEETKARIEAIEQRYQKQIMALYRTPPHMFVLIGDNAAFVEQYTFGKLTAREPDLEVDVVLGSDMPLIEYRRMIDPVYARALEILRTREPELTEQMRPLPYPLLESHFSYAWNQARSAKAQEPAQV